MINWLRNMQAYFLSAKGYSLCYNFAVATNGTIWEIRGFTNRNAANAGDNSAVEAAGRRRDAAIDRMGSFVPSAEAGEASRSEVPS